MISEQQVQRCTAHLELARTAIDNAELRIVGAMDGQRAGLALCKAVGEIEAARSNLTLCLAEIRREAIRQSDKENDAAPTDGVTAGRTVPAEQKTGSDRVS